MVDAAIGGFLKGFMDDRTQRMREEQSRRDELVANVQKMQLKGLQKRQESWDKQQAMWDQINTQLESDPTAAMASYADAHNIKNKFEALGGKWEHTGTPEQTRAYLKQQHDKWSSMGRPELSTEEIEKIQMRRAADDDLIAGPIRKLLGIGSSHQSVAFDNVKNNRFDLSTEAGQEAAAADIVSQKERALAEAKAAGPAPTQEQAVALSDLFTKQEEAVAAQKPRTSFQQIQDPETGRTDLVRIDYTPGGGERVRVLMGKKSPKQPRTLNKTDKEIASGELNQVIEGWERAEGDGSALLHERAERWEDLMSDDDSAMRAEYLSLVNRYRAIPQFQETGAASREAIRHLTEMDDLGFIKTEEGPWWKGGNTEVLLAPQERAKVIKQKLDRGELNKEQAIDLYQRFVQ